MLTGVKSLKIVKKAGDVDGSWLKDPTKGSAKIYFFSGTRNSTVLEFPSLKVFTQVNSSHRALSMQLPHPWQGTGHVVYNGFLYYHKADTPNRILKVRRKGSHLRALSLTRRGEKEGGGQISLPSEGWQKSEVEMFYLSVQ